MSVAPDFLLQSAPDVRAKPAASQPAHKTSEPSQDGAPRFSDVYAEQRQSQVKESSETPAASEDNGVAIDEADDSEMAVLAESGNILPLGEELAGDVLGEELSSAQQDLPESEVVPELDKDVFDLLPGLAMSRESQVQTLDTEVSLSPGALAAQRMLNSAQASTAPSMMALSESSKTESESGEPELLAQMLETGISELAEDSKSSSPEPFASKLNMLTQALTQQNNPAQRLPLVPGTPVAMGQPGMSEAVVERVMWLSSQNLKSAEIQLDPAELGRMEVRIELNKDQAAQVTFVSASANVREQLEGQAHRLRELFAQQGMGELDVNVSDQSFSRHSQGEGGTAERRAQVSGQLNGADDETIMGVTELRSPEAGALRGLVDFYA